MVTTRRIHEPRLDFLGKGEEKTRTHGVVGCENGEPVRVELVSLQPIGTKPPGECEV